MEPSSGQSQEERLREADRLENAHFLPGIYRFLTTFLSGCFRRLLLRKAPRWNWRLDREWDARKLSSARLIWFHAASAGELEILWSVARAIRSKISADECVFGLTVFSPSGESRLSAFQSEFAPVYCGPSPWEGEWSIFFENLRARFGCRPDLLISAKYEAWPELWGTLREFRIPLMVVNAESRSSLRWARRIAGAVFGGLPKLHFSAVKPDALAVLQDEWRSRADLRLSGDPRWDQVAHRLKRGNARVGQLRELSEAQCLPRPWIIVGSAWDEDVALLRSATNHSRFTGTLWLVPHRPSDSQAERWASILSAEGNFRVVATRGVKRAGLWEALSREDEQGFCAWIGTRLSPDAEIAPKAVALLVQEMGLLAELYSIGDAAWVGGGLRTGLHSVIEPALSDLPIAAGAHRTGGFPEVLELRELHQLTLISDAPQAARWLAGVALHSDGAARQRWQSWRSSTHEGASSRVADWVCEIVRTAMRV